MEKYEFLSRTGEGAYGSVWRARDKNTGLMVAVKKMKDVPQNEEESEIAMREVRVLQLAKNVNIVNLLEAYKSQSGRLYLVFEYVERTLLQELKGCRGGLAPGVVKSVTWQLAQALSYLHRKQIIHRDVKPSNILLTENGVVKICDFGFARAMTSSSADPAYTTYVVTRWYRAPEVLVGDNYGPPVDVWALGCIFAEMLAGRPLFPGKNHHDQLWLILKCLGTMTERQLELLDADPQFACFRLPTQSEVETLEQRLPHASPAAMQLLRACLHPDPQQRATAEELLAMPYFSGVTESMPLDDLLFYPDQDMRARLERVVASDQQAAHAAAAREAALALPSGPRMRSGTLAAVYGKPPSQPSGSTAPHLPPAASPSRPSGPPPLPSKASSVPKLDPPPLGPSTSSQLQAQTSDGGVGAGGILAQQRPPLQRYITAPAGSIAAKVHAQPPPLQPLHRGEQGTGASGSHLPPAPGTAAATAAAATAGAHGAYAGNGQVSSMVGMGMGQAHAGPAQARSRSRSSSGDGSGSQHSSPAHPHPPAPPPALAQPAPSGAAAGVVPLEQRPRGRASWRGSGDGTMDLVGAGMRQTSAGHHLNQPHTSITVTATAEGGNGRPSASPPPGTNFEITGGVLRPISQQQRTTWNGTNGVAPPRPGAVSAGAVNSGGANNGGPNSLNSSLNSTHNSHAENAMNGNMPGGHRKAHSLAGNESLPPPSFSSGAANRSAGGGLGGLQGRSLAPSLAPSTGGPGATSGLQLPPSQFGFPPAGNNRLTPSPPPGAYVAAGGGGASGTGYLRPTNGSVLNPGPGRFSQDGSGAAAAALYGQTLGLQARGSSLNGQYGAPSNGAHSTNTSLPGAVDSETSEPGFADASAFLNDGRRASDTALYASTVLKDGKTSRSDRNLMPPTLMPRQTSDGTVGPSGGGVGGGGGAGYMLGVLRAPSFGRRNVTAPVEAGPPSPEPPAAPASLPPLQGTPRRISAPETLTTSVLAGAGGGGVATGGGGSRIPSASASQPPSSNGYMQRQGLKPTPQAAAAHAAQANGPTANGQPHGAVGSAPNSGTLSAQPSQAELGDGESSHVFLPALEVGAGSKVSRPAASQTAGGRRPSKSNPLRTAPGSDCKREDAAAKSALVLEAVPEAGVL